MKQYEAALATASGPAEARWAAVKKKRATTHQRRGPASPASPTGPIRNGTGSCTIVTRPMSATARIWWAAGSPIHAYLKRYKDYLVLERTPSRKKLIDDGSSTSTR